MQTARFLCFFALAFCLMLTRPGTAGMLEPENPTPSATYPLATSTTLPVEDCADAPFVANEVVVGFSDNGDSADGLAQTLSGASVEANFPTIQAAVLRVPPDTVCQAVRSFQAQPGVRFAEPNYIVSSDEVVPNDPGWPEQYNLPAIRAHQGWSLSTGSSGVIIAIIDSGVDLSHPDLSGKLVPGFDFVNQDDLPQDDFGHGTHVAGIAAASSNNETGIAGVSWGAQIMPLKVLDASGNGSYANVAAALVWAADHGARVANLSLGGRSSSTILADAVQYAANRGVVLVGAAGNTGSGYILYPAAYPQVLAVAASDPANQIANFSNSGPEMDLTAPGVSIYSLYPGGGLGYRSGTSMAAPHVAGLAAVLAGLPGNPTEMQVITAMEDTALDLGPGGLDASYGWGLIQMDKAILSLIPTPKSTFTTTPTVTPSRTATSTPPVPSPVYTPSRTATNAPPVPSPVFTPSDGYPIPLQTPTLTPTAMMFTPIATVETQGVQDVTGNLSSTPTQLIFLSPTPALQLEAQYVTAQDKKIYYFMPCLGVLTIFLGIILFFYPKYYSRERYNHTIDDKYP